MSGLFIQTDNNKFSKDLLQNEINKLDWPALSSTCTNNIESKWHFLKNNTLDLRNKLNPVKSYQGEKYNQK